MRPFVSAESNAMPSPEPSGWSSSALLRAGTESGKTINIINHLINILAETEGFEPSIELYNPITV
jgi:hypothetical protein